MRAAPERALKPRSSSERATHSCGRERGAAASAKCESERDYDHRERQTRKKNRGRNIRARLEPIDAGNGVAGQVELGERGGEAERRVRGHEPGRHDRKDWSKHCHERCSRCGSRFESAVAHKGGSCSTTSSEACAASRPHPQHETRSLASRLHCSFGSLPAVSSAPSDPTPRQSLSERSRSEPFSPPTAARHAGVRMQPWISSWRRPGNGLRFSGWGTGAVA